MNFEEQVVATKRKGIIHFQDMDPTKFILWLRASKTELNGILKDIRAVMKIDGIAFRFGKDINGNIFIEGARTGPIDTVGAFTAYAKSKTETVEIIDRAMQYDEILSLFKQMDLMKLCPKNVKVVAELFFNPMAQINGSKIRFVTIEYDKDRLGNLMTILPYTVLQADTGAGHPDRDNILNILYENSNDEIKVINPNLKFNEIDINLYIDASSIITDRSLEIIKSRKNADKVEKQNLLNIIQKIKNDMADYLLNHPGIEDKFKLGPDIEGIVLWIGNEQYKITTPNFKQQHAKGK